MCADTPADNVSGAKIGKSFDKWHTMGELFLCFPIKRDIFGGENAGDGGNLKRFTIGRFTIGVQSKQAIVNEIVLNRK